ncbi:MAG: ribose-phosphate diphosphokinase [Bacillota bacterium]
MSPKSQIKVFAGSTGDIFAQRICDYLKIKLGKSKVITFSEGNIMVKSQETVRDKDVYLIQSIGLNPNKEFTEILFWMDAFKRASAFSVTSIMPFFSYAQGDKKDEPRVSIRGRVCAEAIEMAGADRLVTMDLHSPQIQGFFKKPVDHLYALPILCEYFKDNFDLSNSVVVSPDAGYAKQARRFSSYLNLPVAIGDKRRINHEEKAEILEIIGHVEGRDALVFDDFSISGRTLVDLARGLKDRGAKNIYAGLSHLLLNEEGVKRIENSPIDAVIGTDSVKNDYINNSDKIKVVSVAPLFAETIYRIHNRISVSPLFNNVPERVLEKSRLE